MIRFLTTDFCLQRINITATSPFGKSALHFSADCDYPHKWRTEGGYENKAVYTYCRGTHPITVRQYFSEKLATISTDTLYTNLL